ncbi:MAG: hypothetical protein D9C04_00155, partial [Nitrosopumilus sp. B06]
FDEKTKRFVIIEYKKQADTGLFDQGLGYLGLLMDRKADFLNEYNVKKNKHLRKDDVNWEKSKVIFISPDFNKNQTHASRLALNIELWEIHLYDGIIELNEITGLKKKYLLTQDGKTQNNEISLAYSEAYHKNSTPQTFSLYERFRNEINKFGNVTLSAGKERISFTSNIRFAVFYFRKTKLLIQFLTTSQTSDPLNLIRSGKEMKYPNLSRGLITINNHSNFDYILNLIKASYTTSLGITQSDIAGVAVQNRRK